MIIETCTTNFGYLNLEPFELANMNQLNAAWVAAAITVLSAPHPIVPHTQHILQDRNPTTSFGILLSAAAATATVLNPTRPHPEQGGQRITLFWLQSLSEESCLWHFRLAHICCHLISAGSNELWNMQIHGWRAH
jgi:hypothetical protein